MEMRSYGAARTYFSILGFLSWAVIIVGALIALVGIGTMGQVSRGYGGPSMAGLAGFLPGAVVMFFGFMGLVVVQIGRAGVDSAEYAQQGLKIAREQLEISRQFLKQGAALEKGCAARQAAKEELQVGQTRSEDAPKTSYATDTAKEPQTQPNATTGIGHDEIKVMGNRLTYKGQTAELIGGRWTLDGTQFETREKVAQFIDNFGRKASPKALPGAAQ